MSRMRLSRASAAFGLCTTSCLLVVDTLGLSGGAAPTENDAAVEASAFDGGQDAGGSLSDAGMAYTNIVREDNPILYLRLGETSGLVAADEVGGHNGSISADVVLGEPSLVKGESNPAMRMKDNGYVSVPAFDGVLAGLKAYSIEAWILVPAQQTLTTWILGRDDVGSSRYGTSLILDKAAVALERWTIDAGARRATGGNIVFGQPSHVVATYDGTAIQVWVDAVPSASAAAAAENVADTSSLPISIGSQSKHLNGFFRGTIDEVAIYDHVLKSDRIAAHWNAGRP